MADQLQVFEVITVGGLRWNVRLKGKEQLDGAIDRGEILEAKVPNTMGDDYPWHINAAHIVAYQPEEAE